jgi:hypothetical protein
METHKVGYMPAGQSAEECAAQSTDYKTLQVYSWARHVTLLVDSCVVFRCDFDWIGALTIDVHAAAMHH